MSTPDHLEELLAAVGRSPMTRREMLRRVGGGAFVVAAGATLGACGSSSPQRPQGKAQPTATKRGGTLLVGAGEDGYEVRGGGGGQVGQYPLNANIFESLTRMDANYAVVPGLATAWKSQSPDTWRFTLRPGVTFHDGTPFTAQAVRYTFDQIAANGGGTPGLKKGGTTIVDDHTVDVATTSANLRLPEQLVHPEYSILATGSDPAKKPVGTGPFAFVSYERQNHITVRRFDGYWGQKAVLDQITFRFLPDPNSRRLALQAGEVQLIIEVPYAAVKDLRSKGFEIATSKVGAYEAFYQNISGKKGYTILQDVDVRHAVAMAIDRSALINGVFEGLAVEEQTLIPARLLGPANAAKVKGYTHDPAQAKQLLDKAGWTTASGGTRSKAGKPLKLQLIDGFPSASVHGDVPAFLQDQLKQVGVAVDIVKMPDSPSYSDRVASGQGDLWLERGNQNDANPAFLPAILFWEKGYFGQNAYQPLFAPHDSFNGLIEQALAAPDPDTAKTLTAEAMHVLIDQDAIAVPLAGITTIAATSAKVRNFQPQPSSLQTRYDTVALAT